MMLTFKAAVMERQQEIFNRLIPKDIQLHRTCFYQTAATILALSTESGGKALVQAGSAFWRAVSPAKDDGIQSTYYGYEYEGWNTPDLLPELHCWTIWIPKGKQPIIIDPTVVYLPKAAKIEGIEWSMPIPEGPLWKRVSQIPKEWIYTADYEATVIINKLIREFLSHSK